ncbi:MAG: ketol-acid reductoisomerase [Anaerolineae bacterium]|nr:ketol-acid reductoisomerase [Anaerolineae bacterium]
MSVIYRDANADLSLLMDKQIAILGYGNIGRPIALNLRDSAFPVLIGNREDAYATQAYHDGFEVAAVADAVQRSNVIMLLLPDEVATQVYHQDIAPHLQQSDMLVFASGYNVAFGFIEPPPFVDVVLVAPQTVGQAVREGYVAGEGFPSFVAVGQDASGEAWPRVLAVAKALGALNQGAIEITFKMEAELDLFTQQALMPAIHSVIHSAIEVLSREGFPPEALFTSLYLSRELSYIAAKWADVGVLPSMKMHSLTSQYGTLSRIERFKEVKLDRQMEAVLGAIRAGDFAQEWATECADGYPRLESLWRRLQNMAIWRDEQRVLDMLRQNDRADS